MPGYIIESFKYLELAQTNLDNFNDDKNAFICIIFSACYIEGVINEIIFYGKLTNGMQEKYFNKIFPSNFKFDLYWERKCFRDKMKLILKEYNSNQYKNNKKYYKKDKEYIELDHLIKIRNQLVHLKPIEQAVDGKPKIKICRSSLCYLHDDLQIINDPFGSGASWVNAIMNKDVAEWAIATAKQYIEYLYIETFTEPFGNNILDYHCHRLKLGRWKDGKLNKSYTVKT